ncbi:MAG: protein kinase [Thermoplasmata archaeon]
MEILKVLSSKVNSIVGLAKIDGRECVIKYYPKYSRQMFIELNIVATCEHSNIISLQKIIPPNIMVFPKMECSLLDILRNRMDYPLNHEQKIDYLLQIAHGLRYLHYNNIIHLDLKLDNIMIDRKLVKIIDFGSAEYLFSKKGCTRDNHNIRLNSCSFHDMRRLKVVHAKTTVTHRAPEAFWKRNDGYELNEKCDIWSFGIIIIEIISGKLIYELLDDPNLKFSFDEERFYGLIFSNKFREIVEKYVPPPLRNCLNYHAEYRPSIDLIIKILESFQERKCFYDKRTLPRPIPHNMFGLIRNIEFPKIFRYFYCNQIIRQTNYRCLPFVYACFDLIHRLLAMYSEISFDYVEVATILCSQFLPSLDVISIDGIPLKIINDIIMATDGIIFRFHFYKYRLDTFKSDLSILFSRNYLVKSEQLLDRLRKKLV